jgi:hypothetical protein
LLVVRKGLGWLLVNGYWLLVLSQLMVFKIWWLLTCGASKKAKDGAPALASKKAIDRAILYS